MKVEHTGSEVVSTSTRQARKFGVNQGAQMFKVLSDSLYSDKVRAIIRELSCNAWDAHVAAGKPDVPFEIHLPTVHEPVFMIRDSGTGLSHDDLMELFCTYFGSNKTDSNKFIGALGLGSKSPFCYTKMFDVKCTFEGVTRMYVARVDEHGEPTIQQMGNDAPTPQLPNGIEIKFAVKQNDIMEFENKAKIALEFFEPRPTLNFELAIPKQNYTVRGENWGMRGDGKSGVRAIMGNVAYTVGNIDWSRLTNNSRKVAELPLDIFFNIGDVAFTPDREKLQLDETTVETMVKTYEKIYEGFIDALKVQIEACETSWEARLLIFKLTCAPGLGGLVNDAWNTGKLFGQYKNFILQESLPKVCSLDYDHTTLMVFNHNRKATVNAKKEYLFRSNPLKRDELRQQIAAGTLREGQFNHRIQHFDKENNVHFVIVDLEKKWERYVHYFLQQAVNTEKHGKKHVYVLVRNDEFTPMDKFLTEAKGIIAALGNPTYDLVSSYTEKYKVYFERQRAQRQYNRTGRRNIVVLDKNICRNRYEDGWRKAWVKAPDVLPAGTKYYLPLEKLVATGAGFDTAFKMIKFIEHVQISGLFDIKLDTPIYGLRKNAKLRNDPEWVELTGYVFESIKTLMTPAKEKALTLLRNSFHPGDDWDKLFTYLLKNPNTLPEDHPFVVLAEEFAAARRGRSMFEGIWGSLQHLLNEAENRGYYKRGKGLVVDFDGKFAEAVGQYPLLQMGSFSYSSRRDEQKWRTAVLDYIGFVDEQRRKREEAEKHELAMAAIAAGEGSEAIQ